MDEQNNNERTDPFWELRDRLFEITHSAIRVMSEQQYTSISRDFCAAYFKLRLNIHINELDDLLDEVTKLSAEAFEERIQVEMEIENPFEISDETNAEKRVMILATKRGEVLQELSHYQSRLENLITKTSELDSTDSQNDRERLKFNMPAKDLIGLMKLLKDAGIIEAKTNKDICMFVSRNFTTIGNSSNLSVLNLQKHMKPDSDTIQSLEVILRKISTELKKLKNI